MKTVPALVALICCILAIGLAIRFDESDDGKQINSDLKETEDLPFLRKAEGKYLFDPEAEILDGNTIDDDYSENNANNNDDGDDEDDEDMSLNDQDVETKTNRASHLTSLSDPRRIRIRPRVMRQVRRFVRKPLVARRRRKSRKRQKGRYLKGKGFKVSGNFSGTGGIRKV